MRLGCTIIWCLLMVGVVLAEEGVPDLTSNGTVAGHGSANVYYDNPYSDVPEFSAWTPNYNGTAFNDSFWEPNHDVCRWGRATNNTTFKIVWKGIDISRDIDVKRLIRGDIYTDLCIS